MRFFNKLPKHYWQYVLLGVACIVISIIDFSLISRGIEESFFAYHLQSITSGEYWRIFSAHFTHSNFNHLVLNLIGLFLLYLLHGEYFRPLAFLGMVAVLCLLSTLSLYLFSKDIVWYVGFSGVLHGVFAWGVVIDISKKRKSGYLLLIGLILKLVDEQFFASSEFVETLIGVSVAVDAHLYGAVIGLIIGLFWLYRLKSD